MKKLLIILLTLSFAAVFSSAPVDHINNVSIAQRKRNTGKVMGLSLIGGLGCYFGLGELKQGLRSMGWFRGAQTGQVQGLNNQLSVTAHGNIAEDVQNARKDAFFRLGIGSFLVAGGIVCFYVALQQAAAIQPAEQKLEKEKKQNVKML